MYIMKTSVVLICWYLDCVWISDALIFDKISLYLDYVGYRLDEQMCKYSDSA